MMYFRNLLLPIKLQESIENDNLVVFVGAGVSKPEPSNLPSFNELAEKIYGIKIPLGIEDKKLGEKCRLGTNVHAICKKVIDDSGGVHTELHESILKIFRTWDKVRIVTTNFDNHFSTALKSVFKNKKPKEYYAPALPLGDDFEGVVYLHGSVAQNCKKLILTDADFGRAYLTKGWATKFLVDLFSEYNVLFVGFSHKDAVFTYLARGLSPLKTKKRWTLCPHDTKKDDLNRWENLLDIKVISYTKDKSHPENHHHKLSKGFSEWSNFQNSKLLSKTKRIKKLGSELPPESEEEKRSIEIWIKDESLMRTLVGAIKHPAWLVWFEENKYLNDFFDESKTPLSEAKKILGNWLADKVRVRDPHFLFKIIYQNNAKLNEDFACMLVNSLRQRKEKDQYFSHWIFLLISTDKLTTSDYSHLLGNCSIPKNQEVALKLFEKITKPKIVLKGKTVCYKQNNNGNNINGTPRSKKVGFDVGFYEDVYEIENSWKNILLPNLKTIYNPLLCICEKQIHTSYKILSIVSNQRRGFDILNRDRSSIANHRQNRNSLYPCFSLIVDILREIVEFLVDNDYQRVSKLRDSWWHTPHLILKRLVIYSHSIDKTISPDVVIQWIIDKKLVFRKGLRKEVFDCLAQFYGSSSSKVKKRLLRNIEIDNKGTNVIALTKSQRDYRKYSVLKWLYRREKKCELLNDALAQITKKNPDFNEEKHPEFEVYFETVKGKDPLENFNCEQTLFNPPQDFANKLIQRRIYKPDDFWNYTESITKLFLKDKDWTHRMVIHLGLENKLDGDDWCTILYRLGEIPKSNEMWKWLLHLFEELPQESKIYCGIANLLHDSIWKENSKITSDEIERTTVLMKNAWELCKDNSGLNQQPHLNWFQNAMCHVGGWMGQYWINYCIHLFYNNRENWRGIPTFIKQVICEAINGKSDALVCARISITPWIGSFYEMDAEFSKTVFLPMFEWENDSIKAQQTWSVLLNYKRGRSPELEKVLIPYYKELANKVKDILNEASENINKLDKSALINFGFCIAAISIHEERNPLKSGFIDHFLPKMQPDSKIGFADWIKSFLKESPSEQKETIWNSWLKDYVGLRIHGNPTPLEPEEGNEMIQWCLYLETVFSEAVELLVMVKCSEVPADEIIGALKSSNLVETEPLYSCKLVFTSLENERFPTPDEPILRLYKKWRVVLNKGKDGIFEKFENLLIKRGVI